MTTAVIHTAASAAHQLHDQALSQSISASVRQQHTPYRHNNYLKLSVQIGLPYVSMQQARSGCSVLTMHKVTLQNRYCCARYCSEELAVAYDY
eukprot:20662-Heterococcus_DN1.PRE.5